MKGDEIAAERQEREDRREVAVADERLAGAPGELAIEKRGAYWRFRFDADAFLHHMIRNVVGCLVAVGSSARP